MEKLMALWNFFNYGFSEIGVKKRYNDRLKQKVRIINQYWLLYVISVCIVMLELRHYGCEKSHTVFLICLLVASLVTLVFNKFHKHETAIMLLYVFVFLTIYHGDSITRGKAGFSLFYFVGFFSIMCLMGVSGAKNILFYCVVMLIAMGSNIYWKYEIFPVSGIASKELMKIYFLNLFLTLALFLYFSVLVLKMAKREKKLYLNYLREKIMKENIANKSIKEKEILLSELHHRVKNNLAIISSMLNMQASKTNDTLTKSALLDTKNRVISMSLVHDMLYRSGVSSHINFAEYCEKLAKNVARSFPEFEEKVKLIYKTEETYLTLSDAIPCGMILNELLTNSYKHAFKTATTGEIVISLSSRNKQVEITISDNGTFPDSKESEQGTTMGKTIIEALAGQLSAVWKYSFDGGTKFAINFSRN